MKISNNNNHLISLFRFILLFSIVFCAICLINVYVYKTYLRSSALKFGNEVKTLIVGDSHPMTSLDPSIIKGSVNISLNSENYLFTYYKVKHILSKNPQIRNVVLGLSYHDISKSYEEGHLFSEDKMKESLDTYYLLIDDEGKRIIRSFKPSYIENYLKYDIGVPISCYKNDLFIKTICNRELYRKDYPFLGYYYNSNKSNLNKGQIILKINKYFYVDNKYCGTSKLMVKYLLKIIETCRNKGIKVYLYNSPLYPFYKEHVPLLSVMDFNALVNHVMNKYTGVTYIDHTDYYLENTCFGDGDHVNSNGAKITSNEIFKVLEKAAGDQ